MFDRNRKREKMMGLKIPLSLLQAWRLPANPRASKAIRTVLSDEEKVRLSQCVWVQEDGEIWTNVSGRMIHLKKQKKGRYWYVRISLVQDKRRAFSVSRLIMMSWHSKLLMERCSEAVAAGDLEHVHPDDWEAGHINDDPDDNRAVNIEPQTQNENMTQSYARPDRRSNGPARSRPVVIAEVQAQASAQARAFPVGHTFPSGSDAARQTGIHDASIRNSMTKGYFAGGVRFVNGVLESDTDPPGRAWYPSNESGKWCTSFGGHGIRVSNDGWVWNKMGSLKSPGFVMTGTIYLQIKAGYKTWFVHTLLLRVANGKFDENGEWLAQEVPKDDKGNDMVCLHGGPGRAPNAERRVNGVERNHFVDLRWGTKQDNAADAAHERARKRARVA